MPGIRSPKVAQSPSVTLKTRGSSCSCSGTAPTPRRATPGAIRHSPYPITASATRRRPGRSPTRPPRQHGADDEGGHHGGRAAQHSAWRRWAPPRRAGPRTSPSPGSISAGCRRHRRPWARYREPALPPVRLPGGPGPAGGPGRLSARALSESPSGRVGPPRRPVPPAATARERFRFRFGCGCGSTHPPPRSRPRGRRLCVLRPSDRSAYLERPAPVGRRRPAQLDPGPPEVGCSASGAPGSRPRHVGQRPQRGGTEERRAPRS